MKDAPEPARGQPAQCGALQDTTRTKASRVDSIPPTKECMDLLACLEGWNNYQLPHELGNRTGGSTKPLCERQLPKELLSVLVEYTVSHCLQLVLSSKCGHLEDRCHFGSPDKVTRRWWFSPDADMRDIRGRGRIRSHGDRHTRKTA